MMSSFLKKSLSGVFSLFLAATALTQSNMDCTQRVIVATALDTHLAPVANLVTADFHLSHPSGGGKVTSSEFLGNANGRVVVVLDMSGSMSAGSGSHKWKIAHAMASAFVSWAPPKEQISLLAFAGSVQQRFSFSDGRKPLQDWLTSEPVLRGKQLHGCSPLWDTVLEAGGQLNPAQPGDAIYLISDGGDNCSKATPSLVEHSLLDSGIRVFAFLLNDRGKEEKLSPELIGDLTRQSGGLIANVDALQPPYGRDDYRLNSKIRAAIQDATLMILSQLSNFYVLSIEGVDPSSKAKHWDLEVIDAQGRKRKGITLVYQHLLPSCPQQATK